jgi:preprotein translocase subunit SecA
MMEESLDEKLALWAPEKAHCRTNGISQSLTALGWPADLRPEVELDYTRKLSENQAELKEELLDVAAESLSSSGTGFRRSEMFQQLSRMVLLQVMDTAWVEHLTYLEQLSEKGFS